MGRLSQLNCFSRSKKGRGGKKSPKRVDTQDPLDAGDAPVNYDDVQELLMAPTRSMSNLNSPQTSRSRSFESSRSRIGRTFSSSEKSRGSKLSPKIGASRKQSQHPYDDGDDSLPTMDSDYKQVNSGDLSLSDAGGTFNSNNQSLSNFSHTGSAFGTLGGSTREHEYSSRLTERWSQDRLSQSQHQQEEMIDVEAPSGKLGLVIDTPAAGDGRAAPTVHAIKDTCPIRDEIHVGDRLVAVDDVDVRDMSAVEVSRVISTKSSQDVRRLVLVRTARGRDGVYYA